MSRPEPLHWTTFWSLVIFGVYLGGGIGPVHGFDLFLIYIGVLTLVGLVRGEDLWDLIPLGNSSH